MKISSFVVAFLWFLSLSATAAIDTVTIAILAKDKEPFLPFYFACLEQQTWPKQKTRLYIRTNNNKDNTKQMLQAWIEKVKDQYLEIYFNDSDVPEKVQQYGQHEWNAERFKVLARIRQESLEWAYARNSHYFVVDCDNFIIPCTLETLLNVNLPIVAPLLYSHCRYSNYHCDITEDGYFINTPRYDPILCQNFTGLIEVPVVHCTYLIRHEFLPAMTYTDNTGRHEYVIFSDNARKKGIGQYLDNRKVYGNLTLGETKDDLYHEPWFLKFVLENPFLQKCIS